MHRYVVKRIILLIPVILGATLIIFFIMSLAKGDPGSVILGQAGTEETITKLNESLGYYDPFFIRYFRYIKSLFVDFDFGYSWKTGLPVVNEITKRLPVTLTLASVGVFTASFIGIPLGILTATKQFTLLDDIPTAIAMIFAATPIFWLGMLLVLIFSLWLGWLPTFGSTSWKNFILPMVSIGLCYGARQMRYTRSSMLESIREDYVRTARAKGAQERTVIWKHALRNALLPVVTVMGNEFGALCGGSAVIENLFAIPGIGSYIVQGINFRDVPVVTGCVVVVAILYSCVTLVVDLTYAFIDPRTKAKFTK